MVYYKIVNFDRTEAGKQFNGAIKTSLTTLYDDIRPPPKKDYLGLSGTI